MQDDHQCLCLAPEIVEKLARIASLKGMEVPELVVSIVDDYLAGRGSAAFTKERRRYPRAKADIGASLFQEGPDGPGPTVAAQLNNISMSGANLTLPGDHGNELGELAEGGEISVEFSFPDSEATIAFKSELAWVEHQDDGTNAGIRFGIVNIDSYMILAEHLDELL